MVSKRYFVMRHGASESNVAGKVQGVQDVPLAPLGRRQAADAGASLQGQGITHIYASPLKRAHQTATIVAEALGLQVQTLEGLRARDLGEWAGMSRAKIKEMWNDLDHPFRKDPDFAPPGGESLRTATQRNFDAIDATLAQMHDDQQPLFVMHLIGTGALVHRLKDERPAFKNTETWRLDHDTKHAQAVFVPQDEYLPGHE